LNGIGIFDIFIKPKMREELLSAKEIAEFLRLPLVKIHRWVHQGKIPCKFKEGVCYFKQEEVLIWAEEHHIIIPQPKPAATKAEADTGGLTQAVIRGGFFFDLEGADIYEAFKNAVRHMPFLEDQSDTVLNALLDREEIASTGIGKGVAIPHPRKVLSLGLDKPVIPVFFLENQVDFGAVDGLPVRILFFMFNPDTKTHLEMLSRLSFCLRSPVFLEALKYPKDGNPVLEAMQEIEARFTNK
jgi:PTS system nitrogen regulatory IIA component